MRATWIAMLAMIAASSGLHAASLQISFPRKAVPAHRIAPAANGGVEIAFDSSVPFAVTAEETGYETRVGAGEVRLLVPVGNAPWKVEADSQAATIRIELGAQASAAAPSASGSPAPAAAPGEASGERKAASAAPEQPALPAGPGLSQVKGVLSEYSLDLAIPDSPGLAIVGLGTEDVATPATPRALAAAIHNGVDKDGKVKTGIAIDFAPYKMIAPTTSTAQYAASALTRAFWNTQISLGTAKPTDSNDKSLSAGLGLYSILYRRASTDPLLRPAHLECLDRALSKVPRPTAPPRPGQPLGGGGRSDPVGGVKDVAECYKQLAADTWNGTAIAVSLATSRFSQTGEWGDGKQAAHGGWITASYGFEDLGESSPLRRSAQLVFTYRRLLEERVADPLDSTAFVSQGSRLVGAKLRWRGEDRNFFVEASYRRLEIAGRDDEKLRRLAVGLEWKLADNVWLVGAIGGEGGRKNGADNSFVTTGLKFGSSSESLLGK